MKKFLFVTSLAVLAFSSFAVVIRAAGAEPPPAPAASAAPAHVVSDKQRGDFWFAQYKSSQKELAIANAKIDSLEKLLRDAAAKDVDAAGQSLLRSCPDVTLNARGDVECPVTAK